MLKQAAAIILLGTMLGVARQFFPQGIHWVGRWPSAHTPAEEAYKLLSRPGDPPFMNLTEIIDAQMKKNSIVVDAREPALFAEGRIPGSVNLPFYEYDEKKGTVLKNVDPETQLILYCEGISCELSLFLGRLLQKDGFTNIRVFYGGYPEWQKAGLPIEKN